MAGKSGWGRARLDVGEISWAPREASRRIHLPLRAPNVRFGIAAQGTRVEAGGRKSSHTASPNGKKNTTAMRTSKGDLPLRLASEIAQRT